MPRTKRILPEVGVMDSLVEADNKKVLVEKDTNAPKDNDAVTPQAKKTKIDEHGENADEAAASSSKKKEAGKTTKASGKKAAAATEKTKAVGKKATAAGKKDAAATEKATAAGKKAADEAAASSSKKNEAGKTTKASGKKAAAATEKTKAVGKKANADGKKTAAAKKATKKEKLKNPELCVPLCSPGPKNGCCQRSGKRLPGQLKCTEVYKLLEDLGVKDCSIVSQCMMAGLMAGHIKLPEGGDLDTVLYEFKGDECDHQFKITLRKLMYQPDYAGLDYEDGLENATVFCESHGEGEEDCDVGRTYVTNLCQGKPELDCGKFHNHCKGCPGFGRCLYDYRNACRVNSKTGVHYSPRFVGTEAGWMAGRGQECSIS